MNITAQSPLQRALPWLAMAVAVLASLGVFSLYAHPEFMRGVADMVWGCF